MGRPDRGGKPAFITPSSFDWTDEKLRTLSQEQLLTLLDNLDQLRLLGRISEENAASADLRIAALLTTRNGAKRRKQVSTALAAKN